MQVCQCEFQFSSSDSLKMLDGKQIGSLITECIIKLTRQMIFSLLVLSDTEWTVCVSQVVRGIRDFILNIGNILLN